MRILTYSPAFLPSIGGLELNVANLSTGLALRGHEVAVMTLTPSCDGTANPEGVTVVRLPDPATRLRWVRWCDVFHQANVSLRGLWPLLLAPRPWVVSHHSWYTRTDGSIAFADVLKRQLLRLTSGSIAVSRAIATDLPVASTIIPNAYRDDLFREMPGIQRGGELLFVGRLVSDKGVDVLIEALALLADQGHRLRLTVVGEGPEREPAQRLAAERGIGDAVTFAGTLVGQALVEVMNRHRVLVIPSRYREPFGIVALEGIACGLVPVGSEGGGLVDAIGPCGPTCRNGDPRSLAAAIAAAWNAASSGGWAPRQVVQDHLALHRLAPVVDRYLEVFERACRGTRRGRPTGSAHARRPSTAG